MFSIFFFFLLLLWSFPFDFVLWLLLSDFVMKNGNYVRKKFYILCSYRCCSYTKLHKIDYFALKHFSIYYFIYAVFRFFMFVFVFVVQNFSQCRLFVFVGMSTFQKEKILNKKREREKLTNKQTWKKKKRIVLFGIRLYSFFKQKVKLYFALFEMMNFFLFRSFFCFFFIWGCYGNHGRRRKCFKINSIKLMEVRVV